MRLTLFVVVLHAALAHAADEPQPDEAGLESLLGESVGSSASRTAERAGDAPGTTWSISGTDLKRYGIQSVEEAIRYLGHGMTSHEDDVRLNNSFVARGYESTNLGLHLAVLIDGNQAGASAKTARSSQQYLMPIELVDHIEIVLGPGSVIYGNSAMLGVVNVITHSAASLERAGFLVQGSAGTPGDAHAKNLSWGEVWARAALWGGSRVELGNDTLDVTWHAQLRWDRQLGRSMWRIKPGADPFALGEAAYTREDVFNRDFGGRIFARASYGRWTFRAWFQLSAGEGTGPVDGTGATRYIDPEYGLDALWAKPVSDRGELSLRFYAVLYDTRAVLDPLDPDPAACTAATGTPNCRDTLSYVSFRPFIEPLFKWDWLQTGAHVTTLGAQVFLDGSFITTFKVATDGSSAEPGSLTVAPLPNAALYAQHVWRGEWGTLNAGVRGDVGLLGWSVSPRLALGKSLWRDGTLKAVFATGFRSPTITERFLEIAGFLTSNPAIGPEHVYSGELGLSQRLKLSSIQLSLFVTWWDGMISTRTVVVDGKGIGQFANLRTVWAGGLNFGWQGSARPLDWGLSLNYAPGRIRLPGDVAQYGDAQLQEIRVSRLSLERYGTAALGGVFMPVDGLPDFYATGHVSFALDDEGPRLSLAANLNSPRIRGGYSGNDIVIDPRNVDGAYIPWTLDVRTVLELPIAARATFRLSVTARTFTTNATGPRVGSITAPVEGGIGASSNPVAPVNAMAELSVRL